MVTHMTHEEFEFSGKTIARMKKNSFHYLIMTVVLLVSAVIAYCLTWFLTVEYPTLLQLAKHSPIELSLELNPGSEALAEGHSIADMAIIGSPEFKTVFTFISGAFLLMGVAMGAVTQNFMTMFGAIFIAIMLNFFPTFIDILQDDGMSDSRETRNTDVASQEFNSFIKQGDIKGFLEALGKVSVRAGYVMSQAMINGQADSSTAANLLDIFSEGDAQNVSIALAETVAIGSTIKNPFNDDYSSSPTAAALAAYVLSSVPQDKVTADTRTGYAVFDSASQYKGFSKSNPYASAVTDKVNSQRNLYGIFKVISIFLLSCGGVTLFLWMVTTNNARRSTRMFDETNKLAA